MPLRFATMCRVASHFPPSVCCTQAAMIDEWFRSIELAIPFSQFTRLPRHPAYKYEYFGGRAVLSPRPRCRRAVGELTALASANTPASLSDTVVIRALQTGDWEQLPGLLAAAFRDVPPFGALNDDDRLRAAQDCMDHTRAGGDGCLIESACFVAADAARKTPPEGAILITALPRRDAPHLTWIMVSPWRFGRGLGTELLKRAASALCALGHRELTSTFLVGNERSAFWHWRNGFRLVQDPWSRPPSAVP